MSSAPFPIVIYDSDEEYAPITPESSTASIPPPVPLHPVVSDENLEEDLEEDPEDEPVVSRTIKVINETDAYNDCGETIPYTVLYGPATSDDTVETPRAVTPLPSPRRRSKSPIDTVDVEPTPKKRKIAASRWEWIFELLQDWRYEEGRPPTYEGESSQACQPRLITDEPLERTVPTLVARHDHQLHLIRNQIDTAPSSTTVRALEDRI
ncbi:hypothetical protein E3N88_04525 [Mikania micrantha]|uniref:Uncharacterized protein n=1 Tax=Mikania micrantha TaxID=192012 RepID=A0A5N6PW21_9ASTR|nr:hypothetical protein E3N88_04525 [Mikania micrantha]